jgi:hypothetical protein
MISRIDQFLDKFSNVAHLVYNTKCFRIDVAQDITNRSEDADLAIVRVEPYRLFGLAYNTCTEYIGEWHRPKGSDWSLYKVVCKSNTQTHLSFLSKNVGDCELVDLFLIDRSDWESLESDEDFFDRIPNWKPLIYTDDPSE